MKQAKKKAPAKKAVVTLRELVAVVSELEARMVEVVDAVKCLGGRIADVAGQSYAHAMAREWRQKAENALDRIRQLEAEIGAVSEQRRALTEACDMKTAKIMRLQQALEAVEADAKKWREPKALPER